MIRNSFKFTGICVVLALPFQLCIAGTQDNLEECRSASTDNFSFKECVGLQHQASETLLAGIENSWREYLMEQEQSTPGTGAATIAESEAPGVGTDNDASLGAQAAMSSATNPDNSDGNSVITGGGKVIAIVSDDTVVRSDSSNEVVNISNQALLESDFPALAGDNEADVSLQAQRQRFEILADLYRQYRDERCTWEGGLYGADRVNVYITACNAWLNQQRARVISMQLSEKRANDANGTFFSGFYIEDGVGGIFQSCDRRQEWRITGESDVVAEIALRYDSIARDNLEMAYLEMRGDFLQQRIDPGFSGTLQVRSLNLLRAIDEADCITVQTAERSDPVAGGNVPGDVDAVNSGLLDSQSIASPAPDDITVDALGASGFLYGYFENWVSACAVDQNSVCMAQADSGYSGQGEWRLVVDRSLEGRWRVKLIPTISDTTIGRSISIDIDGLIAGSHPVSSSGTTVKAQVGLTLAQGESARLLVNQMLNGQRLSLTWSLPSEIGNELSFSLVGVTRALAFFDQNG